MRIFPLGLTLFILVPLLEIWLIIKVGSQIGALSTIGLIVLTAVIGVALLRQQGLATLNKVQRQMQAGELPATGMLEGMLLFFAGALLLTPGFFTDSVGFVLLVPPLRKAIALWVLEHSGWLVQLRTQTRSTQQQHDSRSRTLEGDYERKDD